MQPVKLSLLPPPPLTLQYPKRYLSREYSDLLAKYSKDLLDPKCIDPQMNPDLYILLQSLIVSYHSSLDLFYVLNIHCLIL